MKIKIKKIPTSLQNIKDKVYQSVNICYVDFSGTY